MTLGFMIGAFLEEVETIFNSDLEQTIVLGGEDQTVTVFYRR